MQTELKKKIAVNYENEYNSIPIGFGGFSKYYPGIIRGTHTAIVGVKGSGKTKFLRYHWIIKAIEFVKEVNDTEKLDIKIFMYCLKQSKEAFRAEIICSFLYMDYGLDYSYLDLMSIQQRKDRKMNKIVLEYIDKYDEWFEYFDTKVEVHDNKKKPSEILDTTERWLKNEAGNKESDNNGEEVFIYHNPNLFVVSCTDQLRSLASEMDKNTGAGMDIRKCIEKHVITNMDKLKRFYNCAIIDVHDLAMDHERIQTDYSGRSNEEKLEPTIDGLGDSKIVGTYYDFILGIHNPNKYGFTSHRGYNVAKLGDNFRSIKLVHGLFSSPNIYLAVWFNGAASTFEALPPQEQLSNQVQIDRYIKERKK